MLTASDIDDDDDNEEVECSLCSEMVSADDITVCARCEGEVCPECFENVGGHAMDSGTDICTCCLEEMAYCDNCDTYIEEAETCPSCSMSFCTTCMKSHDCKKDVEKDNSKIAEK